VRALAAGCLLLAIAAAVDLAALFLDGFGNITDSLHSSLLTAAASSIAVLSLVFFARVVPQQHGRLARRAARVFWALIAAGAVFEGCWMATPRLNFGRYAWASIAYVAVLAALGWAIGFRPVGARVAGLGAALAGIGCIISLAVAVALSWGPLEVFGRGSKLFGLAFLLALSAAALSLGVRRPHESG
jgi:hypothetical protein